MAFHFRAHRITDSIQRCPLARRERAGALQHGIDDIRVDAQLIQPYNVIEDEALLDDGGVEFTRRLSLQLIIG